jgi:acyl dehydratase
MCTQAQLAKLCRLPREGPASRSVTYVSSVIEVGAEFGPSSWIDVPQEKIQAFADTTDDHNFIHVNPELAAQTPFGGTVAHGYLTLSLLPSMSYEVLPHEEPGAGMALNYGLNRRPSLRARESAERSRSTRSGKRTGAAK